MQKITAMMMLLRARIAFRGEVHPAAQNFTEDWNFVSSADARGLQKKVRARGWHLVRASGASLGSGVGGTAQAAIACGLKLALRRVNRDLNAVEIEHIGIREFSWFYLANVSVYAYRTQENAALKAKDGLTLVPACSTRKEFLPRSLGMIPHFASALPLLKQIFAASRSSLEGPR
jgi:hypothetical protein